MALEVDGVPVDEAMGLGPGTSTCTFGGAPSGWGITMIGPTRTGPTCTGPTVIGADSSSVAPGGVEEVAGGAVVEFGDEFAGGGASTREVPTGGVTSGREPVAEGAPVRDEVARSFEGAGGWIGSTVLGDVSGFVRCRSLVSRGEVVRPRRLVGVPDGGSTVAVALDWGALEAGGELEEGGGAAGTAGGAVDELAVADGTGTIGAPASGLALELPDGAWPAGASAGSRLLEAAFQGLDEVDGSASWVELPVPANVATPAIPNTANTTVAAMTTRTGEIARRGVAGRALLELPLPKPRRSSGVEPRSRGGRWWPSSPPRSPNGSLMRSCLRRSPRTSPQAGRRSGCATPAE